MLEKNELSCQMLLVESVRTVSMQIIFAKHPLYIEHFISHWEDYVNVRKVYLKGFCLAASTKLESWESDD